MGSESYVYIKDQAPSSMFTRLNLSCSLLANIFPLFLLYLIFALILVISLKSPSFNWLMLYMKQYLKINIPAGLFLFTLQSEMLYIYL